MQEKAIYTVMVADDEDELRQALCSMTPWEELGFRLVGDASNGLDALEMVEQLEPDLLLTDIRMPFISGIDLARQVREIRPFMHIAFLSGFDDFEYAKQAIQYNIISYMLKPITREGLVQELKVIRQKMDDQFEAFRQSSPRDGRENFLMSLLLDDFPEETIREEALRIQAQENGLLTDRRDEPGYMVAVLRLNTLLGENVTEPSTVRAMERIACKYFRQAGFYSRGKVVLVLMGNPSDFDEYLHILANEWQQMSERALHTCCSVGVGRRTSRLTHLHRAYREAMEALSFAQPRQSNICFITDTRPVSAFQAETHHDRLTRIENAFKSGSRDELLRELSSMVDLAWEEPQGKNWLNLAGLQLISDIYRILYSAGGSEAVTVLQNKGLFSGLGFHYHTAGELKTELAEFCVSAMDALSGLQKKGGDLLCQQALEAINQHYRDENLSLVLLSGMLNVSPNHLSACIKKYAGESFINILIRKRMDAAKELLLTTSLKIMEVAQQCGYTDQHYFSYCFKKYCGTTPNILRQQNRREGEGGSR